MLFEVLAAAASLPPAPSAAESLPATPPVVWNAGTGAGWSVLSHGRDGTWRQREVFVARRAGDAAVTASATWQGRFGASDTTAQVRGDIGFSGGSAFAAVLVTPSADFAERWGLRGGGELALSRRFDLTTEARLSYYASGTSLALALGPRAWFAKRRGSLRAKAIVQHDETGRTRLGWASDAGFDAAGTLHLTAALARYPESDAGTTRRIRALSAGAAWRASDRVTLRLTLEREDRARSYRRDSANFGAALAF